MNITEALAYIHHTKWLGSRLGLSRTYELLEKMGNPQQKLKFVHIAGTNGKGSTAAMTASMLRAAGYTVGLYTSPYLRRFNERMQVNGVPISDDALAALTQAIKPLADTMQDPPTEFELITALGFQFFLEQHCDIVVLEVGLGGALDSTNVIPAPEAAVICAIGLDHTEQLGNTCEAIALQKAGIIKPGCDVVIYPATLSVEQVFEQVCAQQGVPLHRADFQSLRSTGNSLEGQYFDCENLKALFLPLLGPYQLRNAAVAIRTARVLAQRGWRIGDEAIREGLAKTVWPGRFELLNRDPIFLVDGGHNPQCIEALAQNMQTCFPGRKAVALCGVMADKDITGMFAQTVSFVSRFVTVTPGNPRALPAEQLALLLGGLGIPAEPCDSISQGVARAMELAGRGGLVCAFGSLYMTGEIRACFGKE